MESHLSKIGIEKLNSDSTTSWKCSSPPNYQRNEIANEYSADDECSEAREKISKRIFKTKCHQDPKTTADCRNIFRQTQKRKCLALSGEDNGQKNKLFYPCACTPYDKMQELKRLELSVTAGQQNPELPNVSTYRLQSKCTICVENTFTEKYGLHFTENLVFAVDVLMLMRNLNELSFQYIIYPTTNSAPESPCNKIMDKAFTLIWNKFADEFEKQFDNAMSGKDNYKNFQTLLLKMTSDWEEAPYDAKEFLVHCAMMGHWAACAERRGVEQASYFTPLVICRTIHRLRIWKKVSLSFWKDLNLAAKDFLQNSS